MKHLAALLMLALPLPALAGECDRWTASMQEDEGGPVMMASICQGGAKPVYQLLVSCGNPGELSMRLLPLTESARQPEPNYTTTLKLGFGAQAVTVPARYEEMDGALASEFATPGPIETLMREGADLTMVDEKDATTSARFTLSGSSPALDKLTKTCTP